jgi:hypothetical protein
MSRRSHEIGSGNVFADIGAPNADEHLVKAQLVLPAIPAAPPASCYE